MKTKYNTEDTKRWEELKGVRNENTKLKKDLDAALATTQRLQAELHGKQTKVDRIVTLREELVAATTARDKLQDALKSNDEDLAFCVGHLSHISEKLPKALPPSQEEAQKKGWWQFWK